MSGAEWCNDSQQYCHNELRVVVEGLRTQLATQADLLAQIADHYPHTLRVSQGWLWIDDQRSNVHIDQAESRLG